MMRFFKNSKVLLLLLLIGINALFAIYIHRPQSLGLPTKNEAFFEVKPDVTLADYDDARILGGQYPAVRVSPASLTYLLVHFSENYKLLTNQTYPLFLASKRITELQTWGNLLNVTGNLNSINDLTTGGDPYSLAPNEVIKNLTFSSWESSLKRYVLLMEDALALTEENVDSQKEAQIIDDAIRNHERSLHATIEQSVHSSEDKKYLLDLTKSIFTRLRTTLSTFYAEGYSPTKLRYTIPELKSEGLYTAYILENKPTDYKRTFSLLIDGQPLTPSRFELTPDRSRRVSSAWPNLFLSNKTSIVVIDNSANSISLVPPKIINWNKQTIKSKTKYKYSVDFPIPSKEERYALAFNRNLQSNAVLEITQSFQEKKYDKKTKKTLTVDVQQDIFREDLSQDRNTGLIYRRIDFRSDRKYLGAQFSIYSETVLSEDNLSNLRAELVPIFEQTLFFENEQGKKGIVPSISAQKKMPFQIPILPLISVSLAIFILFPEQWWIAIATRLFRIIRPIQSLVSVGVLALVIIDIFIFSRIHNGLIIITLVFWTLANHEQKHRTSINLALALVLIAISIIESLFGNIVASEKALIWMCTFFVVGLASELKYGSPVQEPRLTLIIHLFEQTIRKALKQFPRIATVIVFGIFGIKNIKGRYQLKAHRFIIGLFISGAIVLTCIQVRQVTSNIIVDLQTNRLIESRKPIITNLEPRIVYHGNKIVVTGKRFGWLNEGKRSLNFSDGTIRADFWSDNKIEFTVPLDWRVGKIQIWIEKQETINNKKVITKSNVATIHHISRFAPWGKDDDAYFEQLKNLSPEVLRLNGY